MAIRVPAPPIPPAIRQPGTRLTGPQQAALYAARKKRRSFQNGSHMEHHFTNGVAMRVTLSVR